MNRQASASRGRAKAKRKKTPGAEHAWQGDAEGFGKRSPVAMAIRSRRSGSRRPDSEEYDGEDTASLLLPVPCDSVPSRKRGKQEGVYGPRITSSRKRSKVEKERMMRLSPRFLPANESENQPCLLRDSERRRKLLYEKPNLA